MRDRHEVLIDEARCIGCGLCRPPVIVRLCGQNIRLRNLHEHIAGDVLRIRQPVGLLD